VNSFPSSIFSALLLRCCHINTVEPGEKPNQIKQTESEMSRHPSDRKVYVGDLGNNARKNDLEYVFGAYGSLRSVWIARNPPGKGHEAKAARPAALVVLHHHAVDDVPEAAEVARQVLLRRLPGQAAHKQFAPLILFHDVVLVVVVSYGAG